MAYPSRIPSKDKWGRREYIDARRAQYENEGLFLAQPETVTCNTCSAKIETEHVNLVSWGQRVVCDLCFDKTYREAPVTYRSLLPNGSLGILIE